MNKISKTYHKVTVKYSSKEQKEILMAWMNFHGVDSIVESEVLEAYTKSPPQELIQDLASSTGLAIDDFETELVKNKNWNAEWEANFKPVQVGDVFIRAPFHKAKPGKVDLVIAPKMAFGTGHHETTHMMIREMGKLQIKNKSVLDYGCGTGILSVYSLLLNAQSVLGIDIQNEAIENCWEQAELNKVDREKYNFKEGHLDVIGEKTFDIILANINRHILLKKADELKAALNKNGQLLMSGILEKDKKLILTTYEESEFELVENFKMGEWCSFLFRHQSQ